MTPHTPTPWMHNGETIYGHDPVGNQGYSESPICEISHGWRNREIDQANAALIVTAVNSHAALVEALQEHRKQMHHPDLPPAFAATMIRMIDAALALAEKGVAP